MQLSLIRELLQFYKMNYSLDIFSAESSLKSDCQRDTLWQELALPGKPEKDKPLLLTLLEAFKNKGKPPPKKTPKEDLEEVNLEKNASWKISDLGESDEFGESKGYDQSADSLKL